MTDPRFDGADDPHAPPESGSAIGAPRWLQVVGIGVVIALIVLIALLHLTGTLGPGAHQ